MAFDLSILNEEERDRVLNIASEISTGSSVGNEEW